MRARTSAASAITFLDYGRAGIRLIASAAVCEHACGFRSVPNWHLRCWWTSLGEAHLSKMPPHTLGKRHDDTMTVRLIRKLADRIDGIDLSDRQVGDVLYLRGNDARLLVAEGWAEPVLLPERLQYDVV